MRQEYRRLPQTGRRHRGHASCTPADSTPSGSRYERLRPCSTARSRQDNTGELGDTNWVLRGSGRRVRRHRSPRWNCSARRQWIRTPAACSRTRTPLAQDRAAGAGTGPQPDLPLAAQRISPPDSPGVDPGFGMALYNCGSCGAATPCWTTPTAGGPHYTPRHLNDRIVVPGARALGVGLGVTEQHGVPGQGFFRLLPRRLVEPHRAQSPAPVPARRCGRAAITALRRTPPRPAVPSATSPPCPQQGDPGYKATSVMLGVRAGLALRPRQTVDLHVVL